MERFKRELSERLAEICSEDKEEIFRLLTFPPEQELGDLTLPCFLIAKKFKKNPKKLAETLKSKLKPPPWITQIKAIGPYLNFFIDKPILAQEILWQIFHQKDKYGHFEQKSLKTIVIDFSSPNISKHLAFHHLRSTMIGNSIYNLYKAMGWQCIGINHLGDWGTTFGQLITAWNLWTKDKKLDNPNLSYLNELYVKFHHEATRDPSLEDKAREWFYRLEKGDKEARTLWKRFKEISLKEFLKIYNLLGVKFDEIRGESFFNSMTPSVIKKIQDLGLSKINKGAHVIDLTPYNLKIALLKKSDGATLYLTRDIAAAIYRYQRYKFNRAIYVVDRGQSLHFKQLFKILELLGYEFAKSMKHIEFGVLLLEGEKGGTRKGKVILLREVLEEAIARVKRIIKEKNPGLKEIEKIAEYVGIGAVVFNDLKHRRIKDIEFRWEEVLSFDGDTGPYVQNAHVRACGIFRKYKEKISPDIDFNRINTKEDITLIKCLGRFPEIIKKAAESYEPSFIAQYLLDLAARFHNWYHRQRVLSEDKDLTRARILVVAGVKQVLKNGLELLGIKAPQVM
jgi:arginyl-tRNA synthetase